MQPPLSALRCFEVASKCQNFSAAADILCLTPSAVSHQIKLLETYLGHQLFVRSKNQMHLTDAGNLGGFNWSSQHPFDGGVDDKIRQTKVRTFDPGQIKLSGEATSLAT